MYRWTDEWYADDRLRPRRPANRPITAEKDFFREQEYEKSFTGWREGSKSNQNPDPEEFCAKNFAKIEKNLEIYFPSSLSQTFKSHL